MNCPHSSPIRACLATLVLSLGTLPSGARAGTVSASASPNALIPDGNESGYASVIQIPDPSGLVIEDVNITLDIVGHSGGGWNGDLYVYLAHGGTLSILVNRPGLSGTSPFGYGDNGLASVTFDDTAALGDFHVYQTTLGTTDSDQPISGSFQPDGRFVDPLAVSSADPRDALLDEFIDLDVDGEWRLFIADLSPGGEFRLAGWQLDITTRDRIAVPESTLGFWIGGLSLGLGWVHYRGRRRAR